MCALTVVRSCDPARTRTQGSKHPTCSDVLELLLNYYGLSDSDLKVKETALQVGLVREGRCRGRWCCWWWQVAV